MRVCVALACAAVASLSPLADDAAAERVEASLANYESKADAGKWSLALKGLETLMSTESAEALWPFRERIIALHREATFHTTHGWPGLEEVLGEHAAFDERKGLLRLNYRDDDARILEGFEEHSQGRILPIHFREVTLYMKCFLDAEARNSRPVVLTHVRDDQRVEVRPAWCYQQPRVDTYHEARHHRIPTTKSLEKQGFELVPGKHSEFKVQVDARGRTFVTVNQLKVFTRKVGLPAWLETSGQVGVAGLPAQLKQVTVEGLVDEAWLEAFREDWEAGRRPAFETSYEPRRLIVLGLLDEQGLPAPEPPPAADTDPADTTSQAPQARAPRLPDHPSDTALRVATILSGSWTREGERLVQASTVDEEALLLFGPELPTAFDLTATVRLSGGDPRTGAARILFHAQDDETFSSFSLGGGPQPQVSCAARVAGEWQSGGRQRGLDERTDDTWARIRLEVRGDRVACLVEDEYLFTVTVPGVEGGRLGLGSRAGRASFRDIEVRAPRGALIWRGLPSVPEGAGSGGGGGGGD